MPHLVPQNGSVEALISRPLKEEFVQEYMTFFRYTDVPLESISHQETLAAVMRFQEQAGLEQDGIVGPKTAAVMMQPRCGVKENMLAAAANDLWRWKGRANAAGNMVVSYYLHPDLPDQLRMSRADFEEIAKDTFEKAWVQYSNMDFVRTNSPGNQYCVNVYGARIDGPSSILADCELPVDGVRACDMRLDIGDTYVRIITPQIRGILLGNVFKHELGHGIGLPHSRRPNALMAPSYAQAITDPVTDDDVPRFQARYGGVRRTPIPVPIPIPDPIPVPIPPPVQPVIKLQRVILKINDQDYGFTVNQ